jgi:hypothetical protein
MSFIYIILYLKLWEIENVFIIRDRVNYGVPHFSQASLLLWIFPIDSLRRE